MVIFSTLVINLVWLRLSIKNLEKIKQIRSFHNTARNLRLSMSLNQKLTETMEDLLTLDQKVQKHHLVKLACLTKEHPNINYFHHNNLVANQKIKIYKIGLTRKDQSNCFKLTEILVISGEKMLKYRYIIMGSLMNYKEMIQFQLLLDKIILPRLLKNVLMQLDKEVRCNQKPIVQQNQHGLSHLLLQHKVFQLILIKEPKILVLWRINYLKVKDQ